MEASQLGLQVGNTLQIQFMGDSAGQRCHAQLIGYMTDHSLLITTPRRDGKVMLLREGQTLVVRMLSGNNVYAFSTIILCSCTRPYPYLHLSYPKEWEKIVVRKAHRTRTNLLASVQAGNIDNETGESVPAVIVDLSTTGALLKSDKRFGEAGDTVTINTRLSVGDVTEHLNIPAVIRNIHRNRRAGDKDDYSFGVEFQSMDQHHGVVLHGYVYERLINP